MPISNDMNLGVLFKAKGVGEFNRIVRRLSTVIQGLAQSQRILNSVMDENSTKTKRAARSAQELTNYQTMVGTATAKATQASTKYRQALDQIAAKVGTNTSKYQDYVKSLNRVETGIHKTAIAMNAAGRKGDAFYNSANRMSLVMQNMAGKLKVTSSGLEQVKTKVVQTRTAMDNLKRAFSIVANFGVAARVLNTLAGAFAEGLREIHAYDQALKNLQAITGATSQQVQDMAQVMEKVASSTKFSTKEVGEGMVLLGQAGLNTQEIINSIGHVANLATGTLTSFATTADLVTTALRAFNIDASESERVVDVFANAVNRSKLTVDKLRISFNYIGPVARRAGLSLEETAAAAMTLANSGIRASTIGTGLRQMMSRLLAPTDAMAERLNALGADMEKLNPQMSSMRTVVGELNRVITDAGDAFKIFGLRAAPAVLALINEGTDGFDMMIATVTRAGTAAKMAETQMKGLGVSLKNLQDKLRLLAVSLGKAGVIDGLKAFYDAARAAADGIRIFMESAIGGMVVKMALGTAALLALAAAAKGLHVAFAFVATQGVMYLTTMVEGLIAIMGSIVVNFKAAAAAATGFGAVLKGVGAVIVAHPIFALVTVIGAVIAALGTMSRKWEEVREAASDTIEAHDAMVSNLEREKKQYDALIRVVESSTARDRQKAYALQQLAKWFPEVEVGIDENTGALINMENQIKKLLPRMKEMQDEMEKEIATKKGVRIDLLVEKYQALAEQANITADRIRAVDNAVSEGRWMPRNFFEWKIALRDLASWVIPGIESTNELKDGFDELGVALNDTEKEIYDIIKSFREMSAEEASASFQALGATEQVTKEILANWDKRKSAYFEMYLQRVGVTEEHTDFLMQQFKARELAEKTSYEIMLREARKHWQEKREVAEESYNSVISAIDDVEAEEMEALSRTLEEAKKTYGELKQIIIAPYQEAQKALKDSSLDHEDYTKAVEELHKGLYKELTKVDEAYYTALQGLLKETKTVAIDLYKTMLTESRDVWNLEMERYKTMESLRLKLLNDEKKQYYYRKEAAHLQAELEKRVAEVLELQKQKAVALKNEEYGIADGIQATIDDRKTALALIRSQLESTISNIGEIKRTIKVRDKETNKLKEQEKVLRGKNRAVVDQANAYNRMYDILKKLEESEAGVAKSDLERGIENLDSVKNALASVQAQMKLVQEETLNITTAIQQLNGIGKSLTPAKVTPVLDKEQFDISYAELQRQLEAGDLNVAIKIVGSYNPEGIPINDAVKGVTDLIKSIPDNVGELAISVDMSVLTTTVEHIEQIISDISDSMDGWSADVNKSSVSLGTMAPYATLVAEGFGSMREYMTTLVASLETFKTGVMALWSVLSETITPQWIPRPDTSAADAARARLSRPIETKVIYTSEDRTKPPKGNRLGGLIRKYASGGLLPGYGGGDRVHALLEAGEYVVRKEAVNKYGAAFMARINNMKMGVTEAMRSIQLPKFAMGGVVPGMAARESLVVRFRMDDVDYPVEINGKENIDVFDAFVRKMAKKRLTSSKRD